MADKKVNIKFTADTKNAKKGVDNVTSSLNKLSKEAASDPLTKLKKSWEGATSTIKGAGLAAVIGAEVKVLKEELKAIKETAEAFNVQLEAETKLAQAAKNNPYLNEDNVEHLKAFASELQGIGNYGDEELIPMMSMLAASGRDEAEIMDIMSAGLDVAAGSGESLDSVVKNLSKTLNGEAGEIADLVPEIKNLSKEQLQSGEAIRIAAEQYKGISAAATEATGSAKQLEMAQGDLKESFGEISKPAYDAWNHFWLKQTQNAQSFIGRVNAWLEKANQTWVIGGGYKANKEWTKEALEDLKQVNSAKKQVYLEDLASVQSDDALKNLIAYLSNLKKISSEEQSILSALKTEQSWRSTRAEKEKARTEAEAEAVAMTTAELEKKLKVLKSSKDLSIKGIAEEGAVTRELEQRYARAREEQQGLLDQYNKTVDAKREEIKIKKEAGVAISEEEEKQELLNTKLQAYINFVKSGGDSSSKAAIGIRNDIKGITSDLEALEKARLESEEAERLAEEAEAQRLKDIKDKLDSMNDRVSSLKANAMQLLGEHKDEELLSDTISRTITDLEAEADALDKTSEAYKEYIEKIKELKDLLPEVQKAEEAATSSSISGISMVQSIMGTITDSLQSLSESISSICNTALSSSQREYDEESQSLENQLDRNLISYDDYLEKKNALDKQAAQKEYKIKMAEWSMNLAVATAQAAMAVVNALASGTPPVNIINAVSAGLLGAAQIVTISANKPQAPSFSTGGFLTGNSYGGDKIPFNGNAGEAILNPAEQRNFLDLANGDYKGNVSLVQPINIVNNAGDQVSVSAATQDHQIRVTIDKIVNSGLQSGTYNNGLQSANANMQGAKYL